MRLGRNQKLKSRKAIAALFEMGKNEFAHPIKCMWLPSDDQCTQIATVTPKKLFKKAVDRNRLKRQLREAFRLNQLLLTSPIQVQLMFVYVSKEEEDYCKIEQAMKRILKKVNDQLH